MIETNKIHCGNCLELMRSIPDNSIDLLFTDPPYALGSEITIKADGRVDYKKAVDFMNKRDMPDGAFWEEWYKEAMRVLKHGGHCLMFGMDRQLLLFKYYAHLAGFTEKQSLYWFFISNFPKASDLSKMIDKKGGGGYVSSEIGEAIKKARLSRGLSQAECDKKYCGGTTNWSWFEGRPAGQRPPCYDDFMKIASDWDELLPLAEKVKEAEREVIGKHPTIKGKGSIFDGDFGEDSSPDITAPSTPLAKKYSGYKYSIAPLKQTNETIMVFQKPYKTGSCLHDTLAYENGDESITCGALDIDGNRVATNEDLRVGFMKTNREKGLNSNSYGGEKDKRTEDWENTSGRYPSQTFCSSETGEVLDAQSGIKKEGNGKIGGINYDKQTGDVGFMNGKAMTVSRYPGEGGCSKILHKCDYEDDEHDIYFYCPKVSKSERNAGCEEMEDKQYSHDGRNKEIENPYQRNKSVATNNHPTVKPQKLIKQILSLFKTPNQQIVLDTFMGSGTTGIVCKQLHMDYIGIEVNQEYVDIANARIENTTIPLL